MNTEHLFSVHASSSSQRLLLRDPSGCPGLFERMHRASLLPTWKPLEFAFQPAGKKGVSLPEICTIYARGILAMRSDVKDALFPWVALDAHWEFLPIVVAQERWWLLNCLVTVTEIDEEGSAAMHALNGEAVMMQTLTVCDPKAWRHELFTLARPSCAQQLFARPAFKSRVERLRLKGLEFKRMGRLIAQAA
ncbi:hypothetical protein [Hydrogenophaga sp.]|uniref:hypothetical protein n=1 Tax=Hydrogenophaga sp. TaxID=1904254 RepID=UPI003F70B098